MVVVNKLISGDPMIVGEIIFKGKKKTRKSGVLGANKGKHGEIVSTQQYLMLESKCPNVCIVKSLRVFGGILLTQAFQRSGNPRVCDPLWVLGFMWERIQIQANIELK